MLHVQRRFRLLLTRVTRHGRRIRHIRRFASSAWTPNANSTPPEWASTTERSRIERARPWCGCGSGITKFMIGSLGRPPAAYAWSDEGSVQTTGIAQHAMADPASLFGSLKTSTSHASYDSKTGIVKHAMTSDPSFHSSSRSARSYDTTFGSPAERRNGIGENDLAYESIIHNPSSYIPGGASRRIVLRCR